MHCPEEAKEFVNLGIFSLAKTVFKEHNIDDVDFDVLKSKAKNGLACICFVLFLGVFLYFIHQSIE